jgi:tetratricopeptide (TPR) repeat protein
MGYPVAEVINYLEQEPATRNSAVLQEKLGDVFYSQGKLSSAIAAYRDAVKLPMSPQQRIRVLLTLGRTLALYTRESEALDLYGQLLKEFPDYPGALEVYQRMLPLARNLNRAPDVEMIQNEIRRLSPPPVK